MDLLYAATSHLDAFRDWLEDALPATIDGAATAVHARALPPAAAAPFWLLEPAQPGELRGPGGPMMAGDQWASLMVIVRSIGRTTDQASRMADLTRGLVIGRASSGSYVTAMADLAGSPVARRWSEHDVLPDLVAGVAQVSETFGVGLGRGADDVL